MTGDFKEINGLEVSSFRAECNIVENHDCSAKLNLTSIDLSPEHSGLRYGRDNDLSTDDRGA